MLRRFEIFWALLVASAKMFVRNRSAVFFSLLIPLLIMVIFGILDFGAAASYVVGVVDEADNTASQRLVTALDETPGMEVLNGARDEELGALTEGERELVVVISPGYQAVAPGAPGYLPLTAYINTATPSQSQTALLLVNAVVAESLLASDGGEPSAPLISVEEVSGRSLAYIDFLVPGMLGYTIMQLGLFSVAFGFVQMKRTGMLRRLFATPTSPSYFLGAQVSSRLIITLAQVLILLGVGVVLGLQVFGNVAVVLALSLLGAFVFLAMGYGVAGWAKDENQAAPVTNLISLPMMFLSGVFFPRSVMPEFLQGVTEFLPLTYLNDALRAVINDGAGLDVIGLDIVGLTVWAAIAFVIATRLFKWE